jgi:hypothetical protein
MGNKKWPAARTAGRKEIKMYLGWLEESEKLQAALDKLMGVEVDDKFRDVPAFRSLRGAYVALTGDTEIGNKK